MKYPPCVICKKPGKVKLKVGKEVVAHYCYEHAHDLKKDPLGLNMPKHPIMECWVCYRKYVVR